MFFAFMGVLWGYMRMFGDCWTRFGLLSIGSKKESSRDTACDLERQFAAGSSPPEGTPCRTFRLHSWTMPAKSMATRRS